MLSSDAHHSYARLRHWLFVQKQKLTSPPVGGVDLGELRQVRPISKHWGCDRGQAVDRYYIENFLNSHVDDIHGHVLEVGDSRYTQKFGGARVVKSDILHVQEGAPGATIVADLARADNVSSDTFDCIILTQTLMYVYDVHAAIENLYRIMKPGGILLTTFPGISKIYRLGMNLWGEYWRFTTLSAQKLFQEVFGEGTVEVRAYGNVLSAIAFLHGLAAQELRKNELDYNDPDYEVIISARAVKHPPASSL